MVQHTTWGIKVNGNWIVVVASIERTLRFCIVESVRSPKNRRAWKDIKKRLCRILQGRMQEHT
jgi:hypothetical protein